MYFETIKCEDYEILNLSYHIQRISKTIGLNIDLKEYIYPPNSKLLKCKVIYNANGIINTTFNLYNKKQIRKFKIIHDNDIKYNKKLLNRELIDNLYSKKENCDEIIIVKNNFICDTSIANIAIYYKNEWISPKLPLLNGTTLQRYINNGTIKQKNITIDMLKSSSKIALLNAMIDFDIIENFIIKE